MPRHTQQQTRPLWRRRLCSVTKFVTPFDSSALLLLLLLLLRSVLLQPVPHRHQRARA
jgi:hypothetical protein